jgi:hypothetical protein
VDLQDLVVQVPVQLALLRPELLLHRAVWVVWVLLEVDLVAWVALHLQVASIPSRKRQYTSLIGDIGSAGSSDSSSTGTATSGFGSLGSLSSLTGAAGAVPSNDVTGNTGCKKVTFIFARGYVKTTIYT